jgi:hypothetical protein
MPVVAIWLLLSGMVLAGYMASKLIEGNLCLHPAACTGQIIVSITRIRTDRHSARHGMAPSRMRRAV